MNIIAQLQGGLGNQLFQYASARAIAEQHQRPLLLDQSWFTQAFDGVTPREQLLGLLHTKGVLISYLEPLARPKRLRRLAQQYWPVNPYIYWERAPYRFDPGLVKAPAFSKQNLYLMGYWQSYRYFESIKGLLQAEVEPLAPLNAHYLTYLQSIQLGHAAMVHVRRGDYVNVASAAKVHGFVGLDYYEAGMRLLLERDPQTQFFVFSDDLVWAKDSLPYPERTTWVESLDQSDAVVQELHLMTHCQNHLIANSSLSWWAAWLASHPNQMVICPSRWTTDTRMTWDDLLPPAWIRI
jgi:hypothetical protein